MTDLKNIKKKIIRLLGKFSEVSRDGTTSVQTEIETPGEVVTASEYVLLDDGSHFDVSKVHLDKFSGKLVSVDSTVVCRKCGVKVFVEMATRIGDEWFCPKHVGSGAVMLFMEGLAKKKGN